MLRDYVVTKPLSARVESRSTLQCRMAADAGGCSVVVAPIDTLPVMAGDVGAGLGGAVPHAGGVESALGRIVGSVDLVAGCPLPGTAVERQVETCSSHLRF